MLQYSCSKSSSLPNTGFDLQYSIRNAHHGISAISYVGPAGDTLSGDVSQQSDTLWSKIILVAKPPFTAGLKAVVSDTSSSNVDFILEISVNGVVQNMTERSIPPQAMTDASVQATIH